MKIKKGSILLIAIVLSISVNKVFAQKDTVTAKQGDVLVGSITSFNNGTLYFKTDYARDAIGLKWSEIAIIQSEKRFKIFDKRGRLLLGKIRVDTANTSSFMVITNDSVIYLDRAHINQISKYEIKRLLDKLKLNAEIGYIRSKASNNQQVSLTLGAGFEAKRWDLNFDYFSYASRVDTIINSRGNIGLSAKYILPRNWFFYAKTNLFSSTEQLIDYRLTNLLGFGNYLIRRDKNRLFLNVGGNFNSEKFTLSANSFKSTEIFANIHSELFVVKGLDIITEFVVYPSVTESGRVRSYFNTDLKFSFVRHFSVGLNYNLITDNKPPVTSSKSDYMLSFKLGWKL